MMREKLPTFKSVRTSQEDQLNHLREPGHILGIEKEKLE